MSIIIKGMKMPENCVDCDIVHREENAYGDTMGFRCPLIYKGYIHDSTGRLPECPLVEIPPHGRLIDADSLTDDLEFDIRNDQRVIDELRKDLPDGFIDIRIATTQDDKDIKQNCIVLLREQPTIIEAEEAEK